MSEVILSLKGIKKSYGSDSARVEVLHGIDLDIRRGELVAIIGPSGSGKSTLMNIIGCLDTPSEGSYFVGDKNTFNMQPDELASLRRGFFGFIFQRYHLLGHLSAKENVQVPSVYALTDKAQREFRSVELLSMLGLENKTQSKPSELSGGQQQRVSIARALMNGGQIILADEPTGALDSKSGEQVMELFHKLNEEGATIVMITHERDIAEHAGRILHIKDGELYDEDEKGNKIIHREEVDA